MSQLDQNVYVSYYSSVLAIKLKLEDADSFTQLYDEIIKRVDQEKVSLFKHISVFFNKKNGVFNDFVNKTKFCPTLEPSINQESKDKFLDFFIIAFECDWSCLQF